MITNLYYLYEKANVTLLKFLKNMKSLTIYLCYKILVLYATISVTDSKKSKKDILRYIHLLKHN